MIHFLKSWQMTHKNSVSGSSLEWKLNSMESKAQQVIVDRAWTTRRSNRLHLGGQILILAARSATGQLSLGKWVIKHNNWVLNMRNASMIHLIRQSNSQKVAYINLHSQDSWVTKWRQKSKRLIINPPSKAMWHNFRRFYGFEECDESTRLGRLGCGAISFESQTWDHNRRYACAKLSYSKATPEGTWQSLHCSVHEIRGRSCWVDGPEARRWLSVI